MKRCGALILVSKLLILVSMVSVTIISTGCGRKIVSFVNWNEYNYVDDWTAFWDAGGMWHITVVISDEYTKNDGDRFYLTFISNYDLPTPEKFDGHETDEYVMYNEFRIRSISLNKVQSIAWHEALSVLQSVKLVNEGKRGGRDGLIRSLLHFYVDD